MMHVSDDFLGAPDLDYDGFREVLRQDWGWHSPKDMEPFAFTGRLRTRSICGFAAIGLTCNARCIERTEQDIRRDEMEHYYAAFRVAGGSATVRSDRAVAPGAGDVVIVDA